jgi:rhomboid family protein
LLPIRDNVPTRRFPIVTVTLIAVNVAVWVLYQLHDLDGSVRELGYFPCEVDGSCRTIGEPRPVTVFSSMFMHGGWEHLLGNMLFLWIFGNNVEDAMGSARFLAFYLAAGIAATTAQTIVTLGFGAPGDAQIPNVGASGAIAGVLGAYLILLPNARVLTLILFFIREIPAWVLLGFWFVFQLWAGTSSLDRPEQGGGVAFFAHIGGFAFGLLLVNAFVVRRPFDPRYR